MSDSDIASDIKGMMDSGGEVAPPKSGNSKSAEVSVELDDQVMNEDNTITGGKDPEDGEEDSISQRLEAIDDSNYFGDDEDTGLHDDLLDDTAEIQQETFKQINQDILKGHGLSDQHQAALSADLREVTDTKVELDNIYNQQDWARLRAENPGEWAARKQQFDGAYAQLQVRYGNLVNVSRGLKVAQERAGQELRAENNRTLLNAIPQWQDPNVRTKEEAQVRAFARDEYQVTAEEFNQIDHRTMKMLRDSLRTKQKVKSPKMPKFRRKAKEKAKSNYNRGNGVNIASSPGSSDSIAARLMGRM